MKKLKIFFGLSMAIALVFSSCVKEKLTDSEVNISESKIETWKTIADYPTDITIDNWEEFIYAPDEVINYHQQKERTRLNLSNEGMANKEVNMADSRVVDLEGWVRAFDGVTAGFSCVDVYIAGSSCNDISNAAAYPNNNYDIQNTQNCSGPLCMVHDADDIEGVSTLDLLLTQRHILHYPNYPQWKFTSAWQYLAADVNRNGTISSTDLVEMRRLLLGYIASWSNSQGVVYVPAGEYLNAKAQLDNTGNIPSFLLQDYGTTPACLSMTFQNYNRHGIKSGDVNGTFNYYPTSCN